jgi:predicted ATPase/DNA-binding SARP family transcriptional activator/DNA-binding transcriptional ArsR family regulator
MMSVLRICLFGGLTLAWGAIPVPTISGATPRSLLAFLVTYRDHPHTRDLLAGTFWPDEPDAIARRRLSQALWQIRRALQATEQGEAHPVLLVEGDTVQFNPALPHWLDVEQFAVHHSQCAGGGHDAVEHCESCIECYQGDFLAGYYDDWILVERERLREMYLETLERLVQAHKGQNEYERALVYARRLTNEAPWREKAHREVMRLCHLLGQDADALKQYELCREALAEELGVEPSPETAALVTEIATRSGLPQPPLLPSAARPSTAPLLERPDRLPLVGRQAELAELLRQLEMATQGRGGLVVVYGEAGVGKTRLLQELARNAQWRGIQTLWGRCYELTAPLAYQPLLEVLRAGLLASKEAELQPLWRAELARLLPELASGDEALPSLGPEEEQRRLLEAIARACMALAEAAPQLVLLEDAHWMDLASLEALRYLLPRLAEARLLIVATARTEELTGQPAAVLGALESTRMPKRLDLGRLDLAATGELVQRALDLEQPAPRFSTRLFAETEGNPFFLIETLWALTEEGLLYRDQAGGWSTPWDESTEDYTELPLPAGVAQSIERRLDRLPGALQELLGLAAVIGRGVVFDLWHLASGRDEETLLTAGDELCSRGLLLSAEPDYVFAHDQIRRVTYERLSAPRRRLYHTRVGQALVSLAPEEPEALAYHWTQAAVWDQALEYHQRAGDRARSVYANAAAVDHYTQALEALDQLPSPPDPARSFELHLAREEIYHRLGERTAQAKDLEVLEALAQQLDDDRRRAKVADRRSYYADAIADYPMAIAAAQTAADLAHAAGEVGLEAAAYLEWGVAHYRQGEYQKAQSRLEQALDLARTAQAIQTETAILRNLGNVHWLMGDYARARTCCEQSLALCRSIGDRQSEARTLNVLGVVFDLQGDYVNSGICLEQALRLGREVGDRELEGLALANLGNLYLYQGDYAAASACFEQVIPMKQEINDRWGEAVAVHNMGTALHEQGDYESSRTYYEQALRMFRELGDRRSESYQLAALALLCHHEDDNGGALELIQQALPTAEELGSRDVEAKALKNQGHVLLALGHLTKAADAYQRALDIRRELGDSKLAMEPLAGLAHVALFQEDLTQAREHVEEILSYLEDHMPAPGFTAHPETSTWTGHPLDGTDEPLRVYLTCFHVLEAGQDPRAQQVLIAAHNLLQKRAGSITDQDLQRCYLENVRINREVVAAYRDLQTRLQGSQITRALPRSDAPTGRPLREEEYVSVTWTPAAPEDDGIPRKGDRRRHRLLRLLQEAADQGAAPTVDDLAAALDVSQPTIKRDLAALRRAGHTVQTRGSQDG